VPELSRAAKKVPADLYVAHYLAALPAAARAAKRHQALYAFDGEDFHPGDLPDAPKHALSKRIIQSIEGAYLPGCAYMTAASPGIADAYAEAYGLPRPTVVLNVFPKSQAPEAPTPSGTMAPGPSVYWFSQTIGPGRGLECAVQAIGLSRARPHLYLRGTPAPGFIATLGALGTEAGVAERIHILKPGPPPEMERLAAAFDLGFVGETTDTVNRSICLTNKIFTYLLAGLPVLASFTPAHKALASELGTAMRTFPLDPVKLGEAMDELLLDPTRLSAARFAAWQLGQQRFNWDSEQRALLKRVSAAFAAQRKTPVSSIERSPRSVHVSDTLMPRAPRPETAVKQQRYFFHLN
jgi:glycosyltransferase involved in cell wall biosynthesis